MKLTTIERTELSRYLELYDFMGDIQGKTFLLTGATGLVGSGVIKWLLLENERRHADVRIIASTRNPDRIPDYIEKDDPIVFCEFGHEKQFCEDKRIDYIIHAVSPTGNTFHAAHPVESLRVIIDETELMLEIADQHAGCSMIYLSSEEVYGLPDREEPIPETYVGAVDSLTTRSCYPLGKKAAELLCYNNSVEYGTDVKIIRPTVIHGLLQKYSEQRVANEILRCMVEDRNLVMKSAGLTKKCILYTLDAVAAVFTVLFKGKKGEAYNATNPSTFYTVKDLANHLFGIFRPGLSIEYTASDVSVREGYLPRRSLLQDISKIKELGWEPKTDLEHIYEVDINRFITGDD